MTAAERLIFASTIDGQFAALDPLRGEIKWKLKEGLMHPKIDLIKKIGEQKCVFFLAPVLKVPIAVQGGFTFLPDPQDGTLYVLGEGRLKKLPFTIPQLVQASPCKSSDGVLYAGRKQDTWFALNPKTGEKLETLNMDTAEKVCPASTERAIFIGRTEYQITMFDGKSRQKRSHLERYIFPIKLNLSHFYEFRWNATFMDYSSHILPEDLSYSFQHYSSSADGRLVTVDSRSGDKKPSKFIILSPFFKITTIRQERFCGKEISDRRSLLCTF